VKDYYYLGIPIIYNFARLAASQNKRHAVTVLTQERSIISTAIVVGSIIATFTVFAPPNSAILPPLF
jgi:hypothetical protein